jgi:hypothetical protein
MDTRDNDLLEHARGQQAKFAQLWDRALRGNRPELEVEHYRLMCASWARKANELYNIVERQHDEQGKEPMPHGNEKE